MKRTVYTWMLTLLTVFGATVASADEKVSFEVKAPMVVAKGEAVRVEFSLNASPDEGSFTAPSFEGFDVIAGPAFSQGSSIQIVNGQMTRSSNYTITYVLLPQQEGNFTIGAASVRVGKSQYKTKALPIEVVEETPESSGGQQAVQGGQSADDVQQVSKDDILLRMILSRTTAFKGEPIRATLKLYYRVNLRGDNGSKFPSFNGFWAQEIEQDAQPQRERYNGKVYETQVIKEYLLYPQQSGELTVEPAELNVVAQVLVQSANPDPFFGGGHEVYDVRRSLRTAPVKVTVRDLPAGAPGDADIRYNLDVANTFTKDKIAVVPEFFLKGWVRSVRMSLGCTAWSVVSLAALALLFALVLLYLLAGRLAWRKAGFYGTLAMLLVFVASTSFAVTERRELLDSTEAVVMSSSVSVKSSPDKASTDLFVLHEGTKVRTVSELGDWREIVIADGKKGWVEARTIETI